MRQLTSFGALAILACLWWGTLETSTPPANPNARHTRVRIVEPFSVSGHLLPRFRNAQTISGSCLSGSTADQRSDAWRCNSGSRILDPCFAGRGSNFGLLCPQSPWSRVAFRLQLQQSLPYSLANHGTSAQGIPWALELSNGGRCTFISGGTFAVAGMRLNYECSNGDVAYGGVSRGSRYWLIFVGGQPPSKVLTATHIWVAWY